MRIHLTALLGWLGAGCAVPSSADPSSSAAHPPGITRRVLQATPVESSGDELRLMAMEFPPGAASPVHLHPAVGLCYVVEGTAVSQYEGEPLKVFRAGDSYQDEAARKHLVFRNASGTNTLRFVCASKLRKGESFFIPLGGANEAPRQPAKDASWLHAEGDAVVVASPWGRAGERPLSESW